MNRALCHLLKAESVSLNDIQQLLKIEPLINSPLSIISPLHYAVCNKNCPIPIIQLLLDKGANVHALSYDKCTPLHALVKENHPSSIEIASLLLDHGAQLGKVGQGEDRPTVLSCAVERNSTKIVQFLIDRGADIHETSYSRTVLQDAIGKNGAYDMVKCLLKNGASVINRQPVFDAALSSNPKLIKLLVNYGAEVNDTCVTWHHSPLYYSASFIRETSTNYLFSCGALVSCDVGESSLQKAIAYYNNQDEAINQNRNRLIGRIGIEHLKTFLKYALLENAALMTENSSSCLPEELIEYRGKCLFEIHAMELVCVGNTSLLKFIFHLRRQRQNITEDNIVWITNMLLRRIQSNTFPIFNDVLKALFKKKHLEHFLGKQVLYAKSNTGDHCFKSKKTLSPSLLSIDQVPHLSTKLIPSNPIMLPHDVLIHLMKFFSKKDLLNFALAYYVPQICSESKQHKRSLSANEVSNSSRKK